jgi:hypothetical protein
MRQLREVLRLNFESNLAPRQIGSNFFRPLSHLP